MKPGYKQTEVGVIPKEWEVKTLGSLTTLLTNGFVGTATTAYVAGDDGVLYIQGYNVQENGFNFHGIKRVSKAFHARNKKSCLQASDLLTIQTGDIGVTTVVPPELVGANCHALIISRLRKQESEPGYYCQYFNSERGRVAFKEIETGTTMKHLNGGAMKRLFLPSPPVEEQRAIATALSDVDGLLGGLDRLIAKKRDLKQAAMQALLSPPTKPMENGKWKMDNKDGSSRNSPLSIVNSPLSLRLPGFHGEWEVKRLGTLLRFQVGFPFSSAFFNEKGEGIRLVKNRDLKSDDQVFHYNARYEEAFVVRDGDVLIGMDGDFLPCQWNKGPALLNQRVGRVVPNSGLNVAFAFYALIEPLKEIEIVTSSTTVKHLSHGDVEGIECRLPELPEQTAIAEVLTEMDGELAVLEQRREKTRALKQAMMQELLTGRTRLV